MEGTAIIVRGHIGAIVRSNQLHNFFNGIYTGSSAALENSALAFDADIYDNYIHHIGDDALEPEGACINNRFRNNLVDTVFVGISLAPVTQGPTWVLRSSFTNYFGRGFKWDRASDGIVLVYHNTSWGDAGNINAMDMISAVHNAVLRNNIFQSRGYGVYEVPTGSTGNDWNNDNWYVRHAHPPLQVGKRSLQQPGRFVRWDRPGMPGVREFPGILQPERRRFLAAFVEPQYRSRRHYSWHQ